MALGMLAALAQMNSSPSRVVPEQELRTRQHIMRTCHLLDLQVLLLLPYGAALKKWAVRGHHIRAAVIEIVVYQCGTISIAAALGSTDDLS